MASYKTYKCPYCKKAIELFKRSYWNDFESDFGDPFCICENCGGKYKTGKNYWNNMSKNKKRIIYLKVITSIIMDSLYVSIFIGLVIKALSYFFPKLLNIDDLFDKNLIIIIIGFLLVFFFTTRSNIKGFKKVISYSEKPSYNWKIPK